MLLVAVKILVEKLSSETTRRSFTRKRDEKNGEKVNVKSEGRRDGEGCGDTQKKRCQTKNEKRYKLRKLLKYLRPIYSHFRDSKYHNSCKKKVAEQLSAFKRACIHVCVRDRLACCASMAALPIFYFKHQTVLVSE